MSTSTRARRIEANRAELERNTKPAPITLLPPAGIQAELDKLKALRQALEATPVARSVSHRWPAEYDPDCPACLRGRPHSQNEHDAALLRVYTGSL